MWLEAEFKIKPEQADAFEGILLLQGIDEWENCGAANYEEMGGNYDYLPDEHGREADNAIKIVLEDNEESRTLLQSISELSGISPKLRQQDEKEWAEEWKKFYKPLEIGDNLCICPAWEQYESASRVICRLEPSGVFGTGLHQTTQLCLQFLSEQVKGGESVLDLGCGSGILGIAALKLGAGECLGIDIEEQAENAAIHNAELNGESERFDVKIGDILSDNELIEAGKGYDIIIANIVADVIMALAPHMRKYMAAGGCFMTSGIIEHRAEEVKKCLLEQGFCIEEERRRDNWYAYLARLA